MHLVGNKKNKGALILEILIVTAIIIIISGGFLALLTFSLRVSELIKKTTFANYLVQDMVESVRNFRDRTDWNTDGLATLEIGSDNPYYPSLDNPVNPTAINLNPGTETIDSFTRKVVFERVSRDPSTNDIEDIYNPANDDPDSRKVIFVVSWEDREIEITTYFTNW